MAALTLKQILYKLQSGEELQLPIADAEGYKNFRSLLGTVKLREEKAALQLGLITPTTLSGSYDADTGIATFKIVPRTTEKTLLTFEILDNNGA